MASSPGNSMTHPAPSLTLALFILIGFSLGIVHLAPRLPVPQSVKLSRWQTQVCFGGRYAVVAKFQNEKLVINIFMSSTHECIKYKSRVFGGKRTAKSSHFYKIAPALHLLYPGHSQFLFFLSVIILLCVSVCLSRSFAPVSQDCFPSLSTYNMYIHLLM